MSGELFVELRCEELPASLVRPALAGLRDGLCELLRGIEHGAPEEFATPRRLAVRIPECAAARPVTERRVTGPPAERAFVDGAPAGPALGFARSRGVDPASLEVVDSPRGRVVAARVREGGERTEDLVGAGLERVVLELPFAKSMEWGEGGRRFGRPLHAVSALYAGRPLQGKVAGLPLGHTTEGHRLAPDREFAFSSAAEWLQGLRHRYVEPDLEARAERIRALLREAARELDADPIEQPDLVEEVTHLVEWPSLVTASFDADLLELPERLLIESMRVHQRYFPIHRGGRLTRHFAVISNNPWADSALVAEGNARVLRARFLDARFFYAEDRKARLEARAPELERMRWIRGLGSMADKQLRIAQLGEALARGVGADPARTRRAGELAKCDLVTLMVGEFPELQGHMGRLYAAAQGEDPATALAIEEHYLPRSAGDALPRTAEGVALALADRLDTLVGCFGTGLRPRGGSDPQALRRATVGLVSILTGRELALDLRELFRLAVGILDAAAFQKRGVPAWTRARGEGGAASDGEALVEELVAFALGRFKAVAVAGGASGDLVDAVIEAGAPEPLALDRKLAALRELSGTPEFTDMMLTFKRVLNITRDADAPPPARESLVEDAERALYDAVEAVEGQVLQAAAERDFGRALAGVVSLRAPVARLFDDVLIEAPDPSLRAARKGLLRRVARVFLEVADFSRVSTR